MLASVVCDGERRDPREPIEVTVTEGGSDVCTFRNVFIPRGSLAIDKVTEGGIGTAGFVISPKGHPSIQLRKQATTTRTGVPVRATGFPTERLPLGSYVIQETARPLPDQEWALTIVRCNGEAIPFSEGAVTIKLTRKNPSMLCEFTNVRQTRPGPPPPGPPLPPGPEPGDEADLVLTKRANTASSRLVGSPAIRSSCTTAARRPLRTSSFPTRSGRDFGCARRSPLRAAAISPGGRSFASSARSPRDARRR